MKKAAAVVLAFAFMASCAVLPENMGTVTAPYVSAETSKSSIGVPAKIKATAGKTDVTLKWSAVKGAVKYNVYIYTPSEKMYKLCDTVEKNTVTIKDLEKNRTYYFKVAAVVKSGGYYKTGDSSEAVKATTEPFLEKLPYEKRESKIAGTWVLYEYADGVKYDKPDSYKLGSGKKKGIYPLFARFSFFRRKKVSDYNMIAMLDPEGKGKKTNITWQSVDFDKYTPSDNQYDFEIYRYGEDMYMFVQKETSSKKKGAYIYKRVPSKAKQVSVTAKDIKGKWKCVDHCSVNISVCSDYDPQYNFYTDYFKWTLKIDDGKAMMYDENSKKIGKEMKVTDEKIGTSRYFVYEENGKKYLYYENKNGFYILTK